jgi:hypothetical protein
VKGFSVEPKSTILLKPVLLHWLAVAIACIIVAVVIAMMIILTLFHVDPI